MTSLFSIIYRFFFTNLQMVPVHNDQECVETMLTMAQVSMHCINPCFDDSAPDKVHICKLRLFFCKHAVISYFPVTYYLHCLYKSGLNPPFFHSFIYSFIHSFILSSFRACLVYPVVSCNVYLLYSVNYAVQNRKAVTAY